MTFPDPAPRHAPGAEPADGAAEGATATAEATAWAVMTRMVHDPPPYLAGTYLETKKGDRPQALRFAYRSNGSWTLGDGSTVEHRIVLAQRRERRGPEARSRVQVPSALRSMVEPRWLPIFTGRRSGAGNYRVVSCERAVFEARPAWHLQFVDQDGAMPRLDLTVDEQLAVVVRLSGRDVTRSLIDLTATPR